MVPSNEPPGHVSFDGRVFQLRFRPQPDVLADVKEIPGRRWNAERKTWTIPARRDAADSLIRIARGRAWIIDQGARQAFEKLLAFEQVKDVVDKVAHRLRPPVTASVFDHAQAWLATHVNGYRSLHPGMDVTEVLHALDRLGRTPFGFSRTGELGYASEPGFNAVRPSQLSHRLAHPRFQWLARKRRSR